MLVNLPYLIAAVVLLWLPRSWLRRGGALWRSRRSRAVNQSWTHAPADGTTLTPSYEFTRVRNYIDLLRAATGAMAILGTNGIDAVLTAVNGAPTGAARQVLLMRVAILVIGVLIQTVRRDRRRLSLAAPIFYITGMMLGSPCLLAALGAFAIAWALVPVVPFTQGFLMVLAIVFGAIATFLVGVNLVVLGIVGVSVLPVLISLLSRRPLLAFSRRSGASAR